MQATITDSSPSKQQSALPMSRRRLWAFRVMAVLLAIAPLVLIEGVCRLLDWGRAAQQSDPFVGFRAVHPLFVKNADGTRYEVPKGRQGYFRPESFAVAKRPDEYRIFCLGGSTVQGNPFGNETSFTTWLELSLQAAEPSRAWEVINCGGVSYASYRLVPILEEVLRYQPDLVIFCEGHNEFLEARSFEHVQARGRGVNAALSAAMHVRSFNLAREGYLRTTGQSSADPPQGRPILPAEVEALLDFRGGLEEYQRDDAWRQGVIAQFRYNLVRMAEMTRAAGVDFLLVNPVCNLSETPPFKSEHRADLTPEELERWEVACEMARAAMRGPRPNVHEAVRQFKRACRIDPLHAGAFYNLAKCYHAVGRVDEARKAYIQAKELDVCPLRILEPMRAAVAEVARETNTPLLDGYALLEERSTDHILGADWLADHVHPTIAGHQLWADKLTELLESLGKVKIGADWESLKNDRYKQHFDSLGDLYFVRGREHLTALKNWAAGRAKRLRGEP